MNEGQTASMEVWERIPATEQVEIITRAAKRAVYIAGAYGVVLTADELIGETWIGTVKRLDADRLSKDNTKRTAEGKQPLTIMQVVHRAAHGAVELDQYDRIKHDALPLEVWAGIDDSNMEARIIDRLTVEDFIAQQDSRGQSMIELICEGFTEREIGKAVGTSGAAVNKRKARMRKKLLQAIA